MCGCPRTLNPYVVLAHTQVEIIDGDDVSGGVYRPRPRCVSATIGSTFDSTMPTTYHGRCHLIFGVVRRDALDRIPAYGAYGHADGVLLARLIMLGKFVQLNEPLQLMREHADQASTTYGVKGGLDYLAWRAWFDPKYADALGFPYWRIIGEYARSLVVVGGVPLIERVRCIGGVWAAAWTTKGRMKQDLIRARGIVAGRVRGRSKSATPEPEQ